MREEDEKDKINFKKPRVLSGKNSLHSYPDKKRTISYLREDPLKRYETNRTNEKLVSKLREIYHGPYEKHPQKKPGQLITEFRKK